MSYDLYFYKRLGNAVTEKTIGHYLTENLCSPNESQTQWFFENEDTEVYFSFDLNAPATDPEELALETFAGFEHTRYSFNLNFIRPDFFGREAFAFVDKLLTDLGLYVLNPQAESDADVLASPTPGTLYRNWSSHNARHSAHFFEEFELSYLPLPASDAVWTHNFNRQKWQAELGDDYFVPKIFVCQTLADKRIITLSVWPEHLPIFVPKADYYLLSRKRRSLLENVEESGLISARTFQKAFGKYLDNWKTGTIITPSKAKQLKRIFNSVKFEAELKAFAQKLPFEKIANAIPHPDTEGFSQRVTYEL